MKKIPINFEFKLPERSELYKMSTKNVKKTLEEEKRRLNNYLKDAEDEINELIEHMTKGTNFVENDYLLEDTNVVDYGESKLSFIGEENQAKIVKINDLYKEIKNGLTIYNIIKNNKFFNTLNKETILDQGILPDMVKLNNFLHENGFDVTIKIENLLDDENFYDESIFLILKNIESRHMIQIS